MNKTRKISVEAAESLILSSMPMTQATADKAKLHTLTQPELVKRPADNNRGYIEDWADVETAVGLNVTDDYLLLLISRKTLGEGDVLKARWSAASRFSKDWEQSTASKNITMRYDATSQGMPTDEDGKPLDLDMLRQAARDRWNAAIYEVPVTMQDSLVKLVIDRVKPFPDRATENFRQKAIAVAIAGLDVLACYYGYMKRGEVG